MRNLLNGSYSWRQIGLLKLSVLCIGIAIGAYWADTFRKHAPALAVAGIILGLYLAYAWVKSTRR